MNLHGLKAVASLWLWHNIRILLDVPFHRSGTLRPDRLGKMYHGSNHPDHQMLRDPALIGAQLLEDAFNLLHEGRQQPSRMASAS